jgi:hypothetical protein
VNNKRKRGREKLWMDELNLESLNSSHFVMQEEHRVHSNWH